MKSICLLALFLAGCASAPTPKPGSEALAPGGIFYSDVNGPSPESGDCGGYGFWFQEEDGRFVSGEAAEFEGGCDIYKRDMLELSHNPKTGKLVFEAFSSSPNELLRFEGKVSAKELKGAISYVEMGARKKAPRVHSKGRVFPRRDAHNFLKR